MKNNKGFTLMEMLIVVAIIAVLVAIAIPTFTTQLEKAREATDAANIRSAYSEVIAAALLEEPADSTGKTAAGLTVTKDTNGNITAYSKTVKLGQKQATWGSGTPVIGDIEGIDGIVANGVPGEVTVTFTQATGKVTVTTAAASNG